MKSAIAAIFILFTLTVSAQQYHPVITPGKQFSIYWDCSPCMTWYASSQYFFDGDTVVNGKVYSKLYGITDAIAPSFNAMDSLYLAALLREDTIEKRLFKFYGLPQDENDSARFGTEQVLYDFGVAVGDTVYANLENIYSLAISGNHYIISSIGRTILFNGDSVFTFYGSNSVTTRLLYTERIIGSFMAFDLSFPGFKPYFACTFEANAYPIFGYDCDPSRYIGLDEQEVLDKDLIRIYPNPANNLLTIEHFDQSGTFMLYNINGQLLRETDLDIPEYTISTTRLTAGMYVWVFNTAKGVEKGNLIIER